MSAHLYSDIVNNHLTIFISFWSSTTDSASPKNQRSRFISEMINNIHIIKKDTKQNVANKRAKML